MGTMDHYIIFHKNCLDGLLSAWVAKKYYSQHLDKNPGFKIHLLPMYYGDTVPLIYDSKITIVDFSLPLEVMTLLNKINYNLILIDHHETTINALKDKVLPFDNVLRNGSAGCVLTWQRFFLNKPVPGLLLYAQDRDLWQWQLSYSREINDAIRDMNLTIDDIDSLIENWNPKELAIKGKHILANKKKQIDNIITKASLLNIGGYEVPAIENKIEISETCERLLQIYPEAKFSACYFKVGDKYKFSLRSRPDFACNNVALLYPNSGGHPCAAGFEVNELADLVKGNKYDNENN